MKKLLTILLSFASLAAFATHERAGEITFKWISGHTYSITITTYTKGSSYPADRCTQTIYFGDGDSAVVCRSNFELGDPATDAWGANGCTGDPNCGTHHMGEWTTNNPSWQSLNIKKNVYSIVHTYPGANTYIISMTDPNRNDNIVNVNDNTPFSIQDTLKIINAAGLPSHNNSVTLNNPPIDKACIGVIFVHNPGAVDPDGDSLSYKLGFCYEATSTQASGYFIPPGVSVDPYTGDLTWNTPQLLPPPYGLPYEYNFAMDIEEWKKNVANGKRYLVSSVRRDMQVRVYDCDNKPPVISNVEDTCILAGTHLTHTVTATDQGNNDVVLFTATGGPFSSSPPATFTLNIPPPATTVSGIFSWTPNCNQVRLQPYLVTFKALDDGAPDNVAQLTDYETFFIRVVAPSPTNLNAVPQCSNMLLTWNAATCDPSKNPLYKYKIYRKQGCDTSIAGHCETGVPAPWGYSLIATVSNITLSYTDNNGGNGLIPGADYSYRVVASYLDGAESYASNPVCKHLVRDVPIITNVDVTSTGALGSINVKWLMPVADSANYDTTQTANHGPYSLDLIRGTGFTIPMFTVQSFSSPFFATLNTTSYSDASLNTQSSPYTYRLDFYDTISASCPAQKASSVFLTCNPSDNQIQLAWSEQVPWTNYQYDVYKFNKVTSLWDSIGTTTSQSFTDTGLVNGAQYCYKIKSIGAYSDTTLPHPLINWSQELCCSPIDLTPPCPNELAVDSSCDLSQNILTWTNPNNSCSDDAVYYIIYHSDSIDADYHVLDTVFDINTTTFLDDSLNSIAGCYAVTSVDSFGNESAFSNLVCVDNCPYYQLPNVFTPNGDGTNDYFTPLHPYKFIQSIDIKIYNRWGTLVFHSFDPEIMWNGFSEQTKTLCSDGVYYYVCTVYDIRLEGIVPHVLTGNIHLLSK